MTYLSLSLGKICDITISESLKSLRLRKGISARALADKCGFSSAYISKVESGSTIPSSKHLAKMLDVLNCTPEEILFIIGILSRDDDES